MRFGLLGLGVVAIGVAAVAACTGEVEDPRYGPPSGLRNVNLPTPQTSGTGTTPKPTGDAGGTGEGGVNPQNCTVKFSTDIYPKMQPGGTWKCADQTCHGGATPPAIDANNAANAYTQLTKDTSTGKPYIKAGSTNPGDSGFACSLLGQCGPQMPIPGSVGQKDTDGETKLNTWLQCGAPNN